ncbi:MAG: DUF4412 domain-containing protein [Deltaproteobacteria bacterium]|nr:DUF4412 domain-containing protein [Deltaproteobacteria bacterium]
MRRAIAVTILAAVTATACDKIPGLSKKDADGGPSAPSGSGAGSGGGVLSFLSSPFEGEITMNVQSRGNAPHAMVFGMKSPKVRIDANGADAVGLPPGTTEMSVIVDTPAKKAFVLLAKAKTAMQIDFEKAKAQRAAAGKGNTGAVVNEVSKIEKLGTKETIAGYECENWRVSSPSKGNRAEMCVAEGIRWVDLSDLGLGSPEVALAAAATDANRFPLRVIAFDAKNVETTRMTATKIEKKTLDANRFVVPPDYKITDMTAILGSLPAGLPGAGGAPPGLPAGLPPGFVPPAPVKTR